MRTLFLALTLFTMSASAFSMGMDDVGNKEGADCGDRSIKQVQVVTESDTLNTSSSVTAE